MSASLEENETVPRRTNGTRDSVDEVDLRIIDLLREDGRMSVNELSARVSVSRANAYMRLNRLMREKVIRRFSARVDPAKLGLRTAAIILLNIEKARWRSVKEELLQLPGIDYLGAVTGNFDFVLMVRVPDVDTLRDVVLERLQGLKGVRGTHTAFILDEYDGRF